MRTISLAIIAADALTEMDTFGDFFIRQATNDDCGKVIALVSRVLAEFELPFDLESKDADLKDIEKSYIQPGGVFEVLEDQAGKLLGTYGLFHLSKNRCELRKMYFVPEIRGRGLGLRLLERAVDRARRLGFSSIELETHSVLKQALRLYKGFGFMPVELEHVSSRADRAFVLKLTD